MSFYATEARIYLNDAAALNYSQWRARLQKYWKGQSAIPSKAQGHVDIKIDGNRAFITEMSEPSEPYNSYQRRLIWEKQNGHWMIVEDRR